MLVRQSFDERFVLKLNEIQSNYGTEIMDADGIGQNQLDINHFAKKFFEKKIMSEVSVDANANVDDDSVLSFEYESNKSMQKLNGYYILWKRACDKYGIKRANKLIELTVSGALKIHDQHQLLKPYCYAFSLEPMIQYGFPFIKKVKIGPAKHFKSFINHVIQFTAYSSNQLAGATAYPDLFVYMDWYARRDFGEKYLENEETREFVKEELQSLVYSWNYPFRGSQSAFVNVNLYDKYFMEDLFKITLYPDGSRPNFDSIKALQQFYMEWFIDESKKQTFTFPINTVTFYKTDDGELPDKEFLDSVAELNSINGTFNIFTGPLGVLSSCCRLRNNTNELAPSSYTNSFGAGGISIGSHRVVTLNLPRLAYQCEDRQQYIKSLDYNIRAAQDILDIHRELITENITKGKLPLYTHGFMSLEKQFSTIGFIGINESCEILGYNISSDIGAEFAREILNRMNYLNNQRTKEDGHIRNIEQIPGESAAVALAKKDKILFTDHNYKMYANQYIPLWKNVDIHKRINIQGEFDSLCGGGAIMHINSSDSLTKEQMYKLIVHSAKKGCIYFAVNIAQCRCTTCGKLYIGKFSKSPCHDAPVLHYLRVVGFLTPVENWIPERREEYKERQFYNKHKKSSEFDTI